MKKILKKEYILFEIISFIFSMCLLLYFKISIKDPSNFINNFHFNFLFFLKSFLLSIPICIVVILLMKLVSKLKYNETEINLNRKTIFIISFIGIFGLGLLHLITYYPGNIHIDTFYMLRNKYYSSSQHPLFYIYLLATEFKVLSFIFHNNNITIFIMSIIQLLFVSFTLSVILTRINKILNNIVAIIMLMAYFMIVPIVTNYNTALVKDSLFAITILVITLLLYEFIKTDGKCLSKMKYLIITIIVFSLIALIRNNGIYIVFPISIILFCMFKNNRKRIIFIILIPLILSIFQTGLSKKQLFKEKIAVPIQQLSYTIHTDGNISKESKEYLNKIYPYQTYKENYDPFLVDTIKWDQKFNDKYLEKNKSEFFKVWLKTLPNNFERYVKAYLLTTYGNWSIEPFNNNNNSKTLGISDAIKANSKLVNQIINTNKINKQKNNLKTFYEKTTFFFGGGTCFWLLILITCYAIYRKKKKIIIITLPLYILWLTLMIATPSTLAFRYFSPFIYCLPIITVLVIKECNENN